MSDEESLPSIPQLDIKVRPAEETCGPPDAYKNETKPRGTVFVANYRNFDPDVDSEDSTDVRKGSEVDVQQFHELFKQIGYTVKDGLINATKEDTIEALERFRDEKIHEEVDSLVVIFMSHGCEKDIFYTSDREMVSCDKVIDTFNNTLCPALSGKPKLFLFQMCRGIDEHLPVVGMGTDPNPTKQPTKRVKRNDRKISDVFICYSSLSGFVSYRHLDNGSYFAHYVCKVFMEHARDKSLNSLIKRVNKDAPKPVVCEIRELGTTRELFFNPLAAEVQNTTKPSSLKLKIGATNSQDNFEQYTWCSGTGVDSQDNLTHDECYGSTGAVCSSEKCILEEDEDTYSRPVSTSCQGTALIINNLSGCHEDMERLTDVFSRLGYKVQGPFSDTTRDQLLEKAEYFKSVSHESSVIVIFYGDGFEDCLVLSDGRVVTYQELFRSFNDVNCPSLAGRPKIFIFNTCFYTGTVLEEGEVNVYDPVVPQSGIKLPSGWSTDGPSTGSADKDGDVPAEQDMLLFSVEVDGECERGSLLTDALYQVLQSRDGSNEITSLMHLVARRLKELQGDIDEYVTEIRRINFRKDFYFTPPKPLATPPNTPVTPLVHILNRSPAPVSQKFTTKCFKRIISCPDAYLNRSDVLLRQFGYEVNLIENKSLDKIKATLEAHKVKKEHEDVDSAVVAWLGLAKDENTLYTADGATLPMAHLLHQHHLSSTEGQTQVFLLPHDVVGGEEGRQSLGGGEPGGHLHPTAVL